MPLVEITKEENEMTLEGVMCPVMTPAQKERVVDSLRRLADDLETGVAVLDETSIEAEYLHAGVERTTYNVQVYRSVE